MADNKTTTDGGKRFWADLSKKSSTWAGVAAVGSSICTALAAESDLSDIIHGDGKHVLVGLAVAAARTVLGLVQGKVGNPNTAKFDKAAS